MMLVTMLILIGTLLIYAGIKKQNPLDIIKGAMNTT